MIPNVKIVKGEEGIYALLDTADIINRAIEEKGGFAKLETEIAKRALLASPEPSCILDIGANLGAFAVPVGLFISKKLKDVGGAVFCFEPQRIIFQQLCTNIFLNRLRCITAINEALGDSETYLELPEMDLEESKNYGGFSVSKKIREKLLTEQGLGNTAANFYTDQTSRIRQTTLDSRPFQDRIALVKLDVEGYELEVLMGGQGTLKAHNYPPIVMEDWADKYDWYVEKSAQCSALLLGMGYRLQSFGALRTGLWSHPENKFKIKISVDSDGKTIRFLS